jgi:hypothetical protein
LLPPATGGAQALAMGLVQIFDLVDAALCFDYFSCGEYGIAHRGRGFGMNL